MKTLPMFLVIILLAACGAGARSSPTPSVTRVPLTDKDVVITEPVRMELVRVPAGEFLMGSDPAKGPHPHEREQPQHTVTLAGFYIGKYEVTNAQFAAYLKATGRRHAPGHPPHDWENEVASGDGDYPATYLGWDDGAAFTKWLSQQNGHVRGAASLDANPAPSCDGQE